MTITARYASTCPTCSCAITPGQQVEWTRGSAARHVDCGSTTATSAPATTTEHVVLRTDPERECASGRLLTATREGRRSYLGGDTLAVRGLLRDGGCHWDADRRQWWIGSHETALALVESARTASAEAAPKRRITHCVGCGCHLDAYQISHGYRTCSSDCRVELRMGSGWSGRLADGSWHQGSDD